jgi:peptidyl-tRNA hydrolase
MANLIQAIIVREDLDLPRGLLTAQVAHIHMETIRKLILDEKEPNIQYKDWLKAPYIHVHSVPSKEWYDFYLTKSLDKVGDSSVNEWKDTLYLSIDGGKTRTPFENVEVGFSIGPCDSDKIKAIIGDLPFLK